MSIAKVGVDARGAVWYRGTGIGTYTYQLLANLNQSKNQYRFFWPGEEFANLDITDRDNFRKVENGKDYWQQHYLPHIIQQEGIELYHVPQNGIGLPEAKCCKQVVTIHDLIPYLYPETVGKHYLQDFLDEMPRIIANTDEIITVSQQSKQTIMDIFNYPSEKIHVIYEAAESFYHLMPQQVIKEYLQHKYGLMDQYVLYLGGFGSRKNLRGLLVAFAQAIKHLEAEYKLVLPGKYNREVDNCEWLMSVLGIRDKVIFPGFVPVEDLPYFYGGASLFIYPSFYEGFGLPPLEAMACGTPVITSNTSSLPEVVGEAGLLFNPYDAVDIADKMITVLNNAQLSKELSEAGLQRAKQFSWQKVAAETEVVYKKILQK